MKGLLLKDWYMMQKYCRAYLLIAVVFVSVSFINNENLFFVFYPCLLCGMIPVNLIAYDERSHWLQYSGTLPYTKAQLVSSKYLIGLLAQITVALITVVGQALKMAMSGGIRMNDFYVLLLTLFILFTFSSSICLPFVFKYGVEKGRIAYYVMIGIVCAGSTIGASLFTGNLQAAIEPNLLLVLLTAAGILVYALSWYLSIVFYRKREI